MSKYIKKFTNHSQYESFTGTSEFILPNVSLCVYEDDVHYNPVIKVNGVTLNNTELNLIQGNTDTLVASVLPYNASNKNVIWSSSDDNVATVDNNGVVSGISVGNATITVTTVDGGFTAQCATKIGNNKTITYTASAKLPETTSGGIPPSGLHINSFYGLSNQRLTMVSHTFENGVGIITFNGYIKTVGNFAFYWCDGLTSIVIPNSVTSIGNQAFQGCSGLTSIGPVGSGASVEIPSGVTSIGNAIFYGCSGLTSVNIPSGVTSIGNEAFQGCSGLTSIDIPNSVTSIGNEAFYNCSSLTSVTIPSSVTSIGNKAFNGTPWWSSYSADTSHQYDNMIYINDVAYKVTSTSITSITFKVNTIGIGGGSFSGCSSFTSISIPNSVTNIGDSAFTYCSGLTSIVIPDSVTSIGQSAFEYCKRLSSCTIGSGVISIGTSAFTYCSGLTSIVIPDSVTSIGTFAFRYCSGMTSCTIGSGVTSIGNYAFDNCSSLTNITSNATTAPTIYSSTFRYIKESGTLYVPIGSTKYDVWMKTSNYYLGLYNWTKVEQ